MTTNAIDSVKELLNSLKVDWVTNVKKSQKESNSTLLNQDKNEPISFGVLCDDDQHLTPEEKEHRQLKSAIPPGQLQILRALIFKKYRPQYLKMSEKEFNNRVNKHLDLVLKKYSYDIELAISTFLSQINKILIPVSNETANDLSRLLGQCFKVFGDFDAKFESIPSDNQHMNVRLI